MNPLTDAIPARYRKYAYALGFVGSLAYGAFEAAGGDWKQALPAFAGSVLSALAASNTHDDAWAEVEPYRPDAE